MHSDADSLPMRVTPEALPTLATRRIRRQSPFSVTVAEKGDCSQCGQGLRRHIIINISRTVRPCLWGRNQWKAM